MPIEAYNDNVFLNCPFDPEYRQIFNAIVFTIYDCGFVARCSLEEDASGDARFAKILDIIAECRCSINDISRTELDKSTALPRFNMPCELGVFIGARRFGNPDQRLKKFLILDKEQYRYQQFISDLSGYDIQSHGNDAQSAWGRVRDWLVVASRRRLIPDKGVIWDRYLDFLDSLPEYCRARRLEPNNLVFIEFSFAVTDFLTEIESE